MLGGVQHPLIEEALPAEVLAGQQVLVVEVIPFLLHSRPVALVVRPLAWREWAQRWLPRLKGWSRISGLVHLAAVGAAVQGAVSQLCQKIRVSMMVQLIARPALCLRMVFSGKRELRLLQKNLAQRKRVCSFGFMMPIKNVYKKAA
jgi:hypothetical protein